ncbi:MAG: ComEC/Rec2 family competence protein [Desulfobacterales bacterium]
MSDTAKLKKNMNKSTLAVFTLNVGDGDAIVVRFPPEHGDKACAVVDCYNADKTIAALEALKPKTIPFICATHPHYDHTSGMVKLLKWCLKNNLAPVQFWDSGFRHVSKTHYDIIKLLQENSDKISLVQPTSGYETTINKVRVRVLSPSIHLKNRYDTFGTNINNASIVLKLEYPPKDIAPYYLSTEEASDKNLAENERLKQNTIILGGDAQFDAWARITDEFPELQRTENRGQMINADVIKHRPLRCQVLKVPHHMSKHGISLEVLETLMPRYTIASCDNKSKHGFPHELTVMAVEDTRKKAKDKGIRFTGHRDKELR